MPQVVEESGLTACKSVEMASKGHVLESSEMAPKNHVGDGTEESRVGVFGEDTERSPAVTKSVDEARPPGGAKCRATTAATAVVPTSAKSVGAGRLD